ncbi:fatty acid elongase [Gymnopilus junonius]|uniref:Elongation of fatty acids protein n=1 Tax=Gymnopilus junonius TaxID=109634 RepID=A0A9P5N9Z4_GYMJU|nr:fatty acid elongase [Gymnopilus junonius]
MYSLATFLLDKIPFRLPPHLYSYVSGVTPLSTNKAVFMALTSYLVIIFSIKAVMKNQQPLKLTRLFQLHNVVLSSGSLLLLALMLEEILPMIWNHGLHYAMCSEHAWTPRMEFYYMVNYYFKYQELLDTVFLSLKKKPLQFLHVFHHSATALLCYTQLNGKTSISWTVIVLNLAVHVVMYYYYYATAGGAKFWWKKYLTTMQITQFIIDLFVVYFGTYERVAFNYYPNLPYIANCSGSGKAAAFGCALLTSYLGLFINFYFQTYKKPAASKKSAANGVANGHANGKANGKLNATT